MSAFRFVAACKEIMSLSSRMPNPGSAARYATKSMSSPRTSSPDFCSLFIPKRVLSFDVFFRLKQNLELKVFLDGINLTTTNRYGKDLSSVEGRNAFCPKSLTKDLCHSVLVVDSYHISHLVAATKEKMKLMDDLEKASAKKSKEYWKNRKNEPVQRLSRRN